MGTRGLGGVAGLLLGSVARDVAGGAKVPVTLLR
jgi:nucleotide-binding universal stress UspA family protein